MPRHVSVEDGGGEGDDAADDSAVEEEPAAGGDEGGEGDGNRPPLGLFCEPDKNRRGASAPTPSEPEETPRAARD